MVLKKTFCITIFFILGLLLGGVFKNGYEDIGKENGIDLSSRASDYQFEIERAAQLSSFYAIYSGSVGAKQLRHQVAPLFLEVVPTDLSVLTVAERRELFISLLLPHIMRTNQQIAGDRLFVETMLAKKLGFAALKWKENARLNLLHKKYKTDNLEDLLHRADVMPASLALAQGIIESGWGTSRFAREGNALYGVHASAKGGRKYLESRVGGVRVAAYEDISSATEAYIHLLNTGTAYETLRKRRAELRRRDEMATGYEFAGFLQQYSELGNTYVQSLRTVIARYGLDLLNNATFQDSAVVSIN